MKIRQFLSSPKRRLLAAFSMAEVAISMAVIGTVVGAMLTGITSGFFTMQMARENLRATQIMLEKVETIRLYTWQQVTNVGFIPTYFTNRYDPNSTNSQGLKYFGSMVITNAPVGTSYSDNMKQLNITINWTTGQLPRTRTFTTYIAKNGLQTYIY